MASPLSKLRPDPPSDARNPRVIEVADTEAHTAFDALSAETSHRVYAQLCTEPATPSALAERMDTSLQNLDYHLGKLEDAGLIEPAGTRYSDRGREMTIYAPRHDPLVFTGDPDARQSLAAELPRVLSAVAIVAGIGLIGQWAAYSTGFLTGAATTVGAAGTSQPSLTPTVLLFEPAVLVFLGALLAGLVVLLTSRL